MILARKSIAMMKSIGARGSPWRTPLRWWKLFPGLPLIRILDDEVANKINIHSLHLGLNPTCSNTSKRYPQCMESNAFAMSNLKNKEGVLVVCRLRITFWVYKKLSWIHLFLMKALWQGEMIEFRWEAKRFANNLQKNLLTLWIRLIGWKCYETIGSVTAWFSQYEHIV